MSKRLYVAYGSNLNFEQMKYRCPTAKLYDTGIIEGYELQFKGERPVLLPPSHRKRTPPYR